MMPSRWLLLAGLLLPLPVPAAPAGLVQVFDALAVAPPSDQRYVEEKNFSFLDDPMEQSGVLRYRPPDTVIKEEQIPDQQRFEIRGDTVLLESGADKKHFQLDRLPLLRAFIAALRATLAGDLATLETYYKVAFSGSPRQWQLRLEPRAAELVAYLDFIQIRGRDDAIEQVEIHETNGDWSIMHLSPLVGAGQND